MAASVSTDSRAARVHAMESAIVFNAADYKQYSSVSLASGGSDLERTYEYAGSFAGRNIEKIYALSEAAKVPANLEPAVRASFEQQLQHGLICSVLCSSQQKRLKYTRTGSGNPSNPFQPKYPMGSSFVNCIVHLTDNALRMRTQAWVNH